MEDQYKELFLKLAGLLGWTNIKISEGPLHWNVFGTPPEDIRVVWGMDENQRASMPNWVMHNAHCFSLMVEYGVKFVHVGGKAEAHIPRTDDWIVEYKTCHPDEEMAARVAICKAVVAKLGAEAEAKIPK